MNPSDAVGWGIVVLAVMGGIAGILHAVAALLRSSHPEAAAKLDVAEEVIDAFVAVGQKHAHGESVFQAVIEEVESPEGQALVRSALDLVRSKAGGAPPAAPGGA